MHFSVTVLVFLAHHVTNQSVSDKFYTKLMETIVAKLCTRFHKNILRVFYHNCKTGWQVYEE